MTLMVVSLAVFTAARPASAATELVTNGSVEVVDGADVSRPVGWAANRWGLNTVSFSYPSGDAHSGSRFTRVSMSSRTSGDAKWWHAHVPVVGGGVYTFRDWYRSNTVTQLTAEFRSASGASSYRWLAELAASTGWASSTVTFTVPADAVSVTVYHLLYSVGTLDTDDTSIVSAGTTTPPATSTTTSTTTAPADDRRVVYLTFDDGPSQYTAALLDVLERHGVTATFFMIGQEVTRYPSVAAQVVARGHAVGNHTYNHLDLTSAATDARSQLADASAAIRSATGITPQCARPPYGRSSAAAESIAHDLGLTMFNSGSPDLDGGDYTTPQPPVERLTAVLDRIPSTPDPVITTFHDGGGDRANTVRAFDQWLDDNESLYRFEVLPACG